MKRKSSWKNKVICLKIFEITAVLVNLIFSDAIIWHQHVLLKGLRQGTIYRASVCCNTLILLRNENITVVFKVYIFILISGAEVKLFVKAAKQHARAKIFSASRVKLHSTCNKLPPSPVTHTDMFTYTLCMHSHTVLLIHWVIL